MEGLSTPLIEVTLSPLPQPQKRELARHLTDVFATSEIPRDWVTIVFRHLNPDDYAKGARFANEGNKDWYGPGIVDITIGPLEEGDKRRIAVGVSNALTAIGIPENEIQILFRHVTGRDVAEGGGAFPFRPDGSPW